MAPACTGRLPDSWPATRELHLLTPSYHSPADLGKSLRYDGDLTISLASGLSVRVANDQFMVPGLTYASDGSRVENDTIKEFLYGTLQSSALGSLGRYFLTASYLMVNHDTNSFTMWAANATTTSSLVSVVDEEVAAACGNITGVVQPSATSSATATETGNVDVTSGSSSTPVSAIAGGVAGGVALLALAGLAACLLMRRRRRKRQALVAPKPGHAELPQTGYNRGSVGSPYVAKSAIYEMPPDFIQPRHEMMGHEAPGPGPRYEMDGGAWQASREERHQLE